MITISKLEAHDLEEAYSIEKISHALPWSKALLCSNQGDNYINYKIKKNNKIIGFCIIHQVADEATLFNMAIHPQFQDKGMATALLSHAIDTIKALHIKTLWLEVRASNQKAIYLYETLGFNVITIRPDYYPTASGKHEDAIIMANALIIDKKVDR